MVDLTTTSKHNGRKGLVTRAVSSRLYIDFDGGNGKNRRGNIINCYVNRSDTRKIDS